MITCDTLAPDQLTSAEISAWQEMTQFHPAFASPILSPEFCQAVARVRDDVRVAVYRRAGQPVAFLAHHRRPGQFARPVGAPFADYTALISSPDAPLKIGEALSLAGLRALQVCGLIDPYGAFEGFEGEPEDAYGIDLTSDTGTTINNIDKKHLKNINRLRRRLETEHGEVRFVTPDFDPAHFAQMIALKRQQTLQTGIHDFLAAGWVQALMKNLFAPPVDGVERGLYGHLTTLMAGDTPVTYHFGPRLRDRVHPWISTFDPAFSAYSPGQAFLQGCQTPLHDAGVRYYDLSTGQQHYKNAFCNTHFVVTHGRVFADSPEGRLSAKLARWQQRGERVLGPKATTALDRLGRRLDHMASLELGLPARVNGVLYALSSAGKRLNMGGGSHG